MTDQLTEVERDFRPEAEALCALVSDLQHKVLVKHTAAVLQEMHTQITQRDAEIERLKKTVGTLISWLHRELGTVAAQQLLAMLEPKP